MPLVQAPTHEGFYWNNLKYIVQVHAGRVPCPLSLLEQQEKKSGKKGLNSDLKGNETELFSVDKTVSLCA